MKISYDTNHTFVRALDGQTLYSERFSEKSPMRVQMEDVGRLVKGLVKEKVEFDLVRLICKTPSLSRIEYIEVGIDAEPAETVIVRYDTAGSFWHFVIPPAWPVEDAADLLNKVCSITARTPQPATVREFYEGRAFEFYTTLEDNSVHRNNLYSDLANFAMLAVSSLFSVKFHPVTPAVVKIQPTPEGSVALLWGEDELICPIAEGWRSPQAPGVDVRTTQFAASLWLTDRQLAHIPVEEITEQWRISGYHGEHDEGGARIVDAFKFIYRQQRSVTQRTRTPGRLTTGGRT